MKLLWITVLTLVFCLPFQIQAVDSQRDLRTNLQANEVYSFPLEDMMVPDFLLVELSRALGILQTAAQIPMPIASIETLDNIQNAKELVRTFPDLANSLAGSDDGGLDNGKCCDDSDILKHKCNATNPDSHCIMGKGAYKDVCSAGSDEC